MSAGEILKGVTVGVTTTGTAGSASGNADSATFLGEIVGFEINYHANAPATTDITITSKRSGVQLYAKANSVTDAWVAPRLYAVDNAAAALTNNVQPEQYAVDQGVNVALAQCDALTNAVQVTIFYRR